tara:strand:+ start:137 stop:526 length:390 start_codon:yes stop_codon:yes gene_type:complete
MFFLCAQILSVYVNSWFRIAEIQHLIKPRLPEIKVHKYDYSQAYRAVIISTSIPKYVAVCANRDKMHFFLHDTKEIRKCLWDEIVSKEEKKKVLQSLIIWLRSKNISYNYSLYNYNDNCLFEDVIQELD